MLGRPDPLDSSFWQSTTGITMCSPWLWLGKSLVINESSEHQIRQDLQKKRIYKILSAMESGCLIALAAILIIVKNFLLLNTGYDNWPLIALVLFYVAAHAWLRFILWMRVNDFPVSEQRMSYCNYIRNNVKSRGIKQSTDRLFASICFVVLVSLIYIFSLSQDEVSRFIWIYVLFCALLIHQAYAVKSYQASIAEHSSDK